MNKKENKTRDKIEDFIGYVSVYVLIIWAIITLSYLVFGMHYVFNTVFGIEGQILDYFEEVSFFIFENLIYPYFTVWILIPITAFVLLGYVSRNY